MEYLIHLCIIIAIYSILSTSLNLMAGYCGLLSLAQAAFYGVGAYSAALMWYYFGTNILQNIGIGILISVLLSIIIAYPSLKVHEDYFSITTFGFQMIVLSILKNWVGLTKGPFGVSNIPMPSIFSYSLQSSMEMMFLVMVILILVIFVVNRLVQSLFGLTLKSIREDEIFTLAAGKNVTTYKILTFAIGGSIASIAGVLYAHYTSFIDPSTFTINESIFILSIIVVGGMGSIRGPVVGSIILVLLPEFLRFFAFPIETEAYVRQIIYGAMLVLFMMFWPKGIIGAFQPITK